MTIQPAKKLTSKPKKNATHYINKQELFEKFLAWHQTDDYKDNPKPRPPETILLDAWKIITHYTNQKKFFNIAPELLEEAAPLGLEFCIKYLHNFNPEKSNNPFSYITQFAHNAILQVFKVDKKEKMNRMKLLTTTMSSATYLRTDGEIDLIVAGEFAQDAVKYLEQSQKDYAKKD